MKHLRTITSNEMRGINRTAVLDLLRKEGPTSQSYIAHQLQISLPTVMRIMEVLYAENLVKPSGNTEWSGGRRRVLLELNFAEHLTIGVEMSSAKFYGAVADLGGAILYEQTVSGANTKGQASYGVLLELIRQLLEFASHTGKTIKGVGIGVPGVTYHQTGIVQYAPSVAWRDFPLREQLLADLNLPVVVENDVKLAALGELWFGKGQDVNTLVLINVGTGMGAGIIINRTLHRGVHYAAGEIGYLMPDRSFLDADYPEFGALETLAAREGIIQRAREVLKGKRSAAKLAALTLDDVFTAAHKDENWAIGVLDEIVDHLTMTMIAIGAIVDPEVIILGGNTLKSPEYLIKRITQRIQGKIPFVPEIVVSALGARGAVMGAIVNLFYNSSEFYVVQKLS